MSAAPVFLKPFQIQVKLDSGPMRGQVFLLEKSPIYIGREEDNDIVLAHDTKLSRRHLELTFEGGKWKIKNLSSKNALRVNGAETTEQIISGSTRIQVGESDFYITAVSITPPIRAVESVQSHPVQQPQPKPRMPGPTGAGASPPGVSRPKVADGGFNNKKPKAGTNKFFILVVLAFVGGAYILSDSGPLKLRRNMSIKSQDQVLMNLQKSAETIKEIEIKQEQTGKNGLQFQMAQEQFLKGFRDYRQGQFSLAMTAFSAATSIFPGHELAKKYYYLSKRKFDEKVQVYMIQGKRYLGKNNFRLCRSSYESVMIMLKNENDPIYKEAKQYSNECAKKAEGKY